MECSTAEYFSQLTDTRTSYGGDKIRWYLLVTWYWIPATALRDKSSKIVLYNIKYLELKIPWSAPSDHTSPLYPGLSRSFFSTLPTPEAVTLISILVFSSLVYPAPCPQHTVLARYTAQVALPGNSGNREFSKPDSVYQRRVSGALGDGADTVPPCIPQISR